MLEEVLECVVKGTVSNMPMRKWSNDKIFFEYNLACSVTQSCLTLCNPIDCSPPGSSVLGILQARKENWSGLLFPSPGDLPNPGIEPGSPMLQEDSLPSEPPGKPKNTGVGSLSLLQGIFPTQELNWSFLHCRQILYHLSYQGS